MFENLKQLTSKKDRINLLLLFVLLLFTTIIEMIGIGSIPIFAMIVIEPEKIIKYLPKIFNYDFIYSLNQKKLIFYSAIILFIIFCFKNIFIGFVNYFQAKIIKDLKSNNSNKLFFFYIHAKYEYFLKKNPAELIRNIVHEITKAVNYIWSLIMLVKEMLITIIIFLTLLVVDPKISLFTFSFLAVFSLSFVLITTKGIKRRGKICQEYIAKLIKTVNHGLGSIKETKILNKENYILGMYKSDLNVIEHNTFIQNFIITLPRLFLEIIAIITIVTVSVLFVLLDRPYGTFIPLLTLITVSAVRLIPSFNVISSSISALKFSSPSFRLVARELTNINNQNIEQYSLKNSQKEKKINVFKNLLEVKNLVYCYPGTSQRVINNVSFNINYGDIIGVIGHSGSGKSTLVDLMIGLLEPLEGKILVDGINIKESTRDWQKQVGYVPQEIYLLDDTIKANIAFGVSDEEFNQEDLLRAIKLAQLEEFYNELPEKEYTQIGHRGIRLSGGQRQRLGIARSLYFQPKILVLDEPTSALDIYNEKKIMNDLYSLDGNLTIIIISHRHTLFEKCKKILNLKNGKISETMNYNDLLKNQEIF